MVATMDAGSFVSPVASCRRGADTTVWTCDMSLLLTWCASRALCSDKHACNCRQWRVQRQNLEDAVVSRFRSVGFGLKDRQDRPVFGFQVHVGGYARSAPAIRLAGFWEPMRRVRCVKKNMPTRDFEVVPFRNGIFLIRLRPNADSDLLTVACITRRIAVL